MIEAGRPVLFFGNGMPKWRSMTENKAFDNVFFIDNVEPLAVDMTALSERAFHRREFIDVAYSTPCYLKDFQATTPRNKIV